MNSENKMKVLTHLLDWIFPKVICEMISDYVPLKTLCSLLQINNLNGTAYARTSEIVLSDMSLKKQNEGKEIQKDLPVEFLPSSPIIWFGKPRWYFLIWEDRSKKLVSHLYTIPTSPKGKIPWIVDPKTERNEKDVIWVLTSTTVSFEINGVIHWPPLFRTEKGTVLYVTFNLMSCQFNVRNEEYPSCFPSQSAGWKQYSSVCYQNQDLILAGGQEVKIKGGEKEGDPKKLSYWSSSLCLLYNTKTKEWRSLSSLPEPTYHPYICILLPHFLLVFGDGLYGRNEGIPFRHWILNLSSPTCSQKWGEVMVNGDCSTSCGATVIGAENTYWIFTKDKLNTATRFPFSLPLKVVNIQNEKIGKDFWEKGVYPFAIQVTEVTF